MNRSGQPDPSLWAGGARGSAVPRRAALGSAGRFIFNRVANHFERSAPLRGQVAATWEVGNPSRATPHGAAHFYSTQFRLEFGR